MHSSTIRLLSNVLLAAAAFVMLEGQQSTTPPDCCGPDVTLTPPEALLVNFSMSGDKLIHECGKELKITFCEICWKHRNCINANSTGLAYDVPVRVYRECCSKKGCTLRFIAAEACAPFP
ncbi:hypothetical protein AAVH_08876 [Aphelenchoides avenae]|nr:hypothetical protein AAVH_08876 [Aphelenchus avenae]